MTNVPCHVIMSLDHYWVFFATQICTDQTYRQTYKFPILLYTKADMKKIQSFGEI